MPGRIKAELVKYHPLRASQNRVEACHSPLG